MHMQKMVIYSVNIIWADALLGKYKRLFSYFTPVFGKMQQLFSLSVHFLKFSLYEGLLYLLPKKEHTAEHIALLYVHNILSFVN